MFQGVEEESNSILLGIPGTQLTSQSDCNARQSQIGGNPTFYEASVSFDAIEVQPLCSICGDPMQFIVQVYAPTDVDRTLYFYGCPKGKCSGTSAGWKVYRMQSLSTSSSSSSSTSLPLGVTPTKQPQPVNGPTIDWSSFCEDHANKDDVDLDDDLVALLESRDNALLSSGSSSLPKLSSAMNGGGKNKKKHSKNTSKSNDDIKTGKSRKDYGYGMTILQTEEPWESCTVNCDNDVEMQRRLATYLEDEEDESIKTIIKNYQSSSSSTKSRSPLKITDDEDDEDIRDDEPEAFGRMVGREDDRSKAEEIFFSRVSLQPKQVLRYAFGGVPLWCTLPTPEVPSYSDLICPYCKGERKFEMQLMPGLLDCMGSTISKNGQKNTRLTHLSGKERVTEKKFFHPPSTIVDTTNLKVEDSSNVCSVDFMGEDDDYERDDESQTYLVANKPTEEQINKYLNVFGEDSLNFGVVAIWSCSVSCISGNGKQELVRVQGPADC